MGYRLEFGININIREVDNGFVVTYNKKTGFAEFEREEHIFRSFHDAVEYIKTKR